MAISFNEQIQEFLLSLFFITDKDRRVYWLFLLSGFVIALIFTLSNNGVRKAHSFIKATFSMKYWFNRSCYRDYQWIFINQIFKTLFIVPILASSLTVALYVSRSLMDVFGSGNFIHWHYQYVLITFSLVLFTVEDFSRFFVHWLYHRVPILWKFHAIHHSATVLTPLTLYRVHSLEYLLNNCRGVMVVGIVSGIFMYCFNGSIGFAEILGVNLFNFLFNFSAANLRHSHVWISFGYLEHLFISPAQHQIHHSNEKKHFNKNFGSCLAIWDKAFRSWQTSTNSKVEEFGL
jgi:sterol desaturase/sphingolipid hydroxylase (fatty acid hydroxylase superfamily)